MSCGTQVINNYNIHDQSPSTALVQVLLALTNFIDFVITFI